MAGEMNAGEESREQLLADLITSVRASIPELAGDPPLDPTAMFARAIAEHFIDDTAQTLSSAAANNTAATVRLYYDGTSSLALLVDAGTAEEQASAEKLLGGIQQKIAEACGGYPAGPLTYAQARQIAIRQPVERPLLTVPVDPASDPYGQSVATQLIIKHPYIAGLSMRYTYQGALPPDSQAGLPLLQLEPVSA